MRSGFKLILITLPLIAMGVGVLGYMVTNKPPPERKALVERTSAVRVIVARRLPVSPTVIGFGLASPARTYEAIAQVGGTVEYVNPGLARGAVLPAGAVLLRLSPVDYTLAIAQARANIRAIEAVLKELAVSEENQAAALEIENEALVLKAQDLKRFEKLFSGGTISQNSLDVARTALLAQRQKVLSIESTLALLPTQREVQQQQIAVSQTNLETAKLNLSRTELTLPFSARVASVSVEVGQYLSAGKTSAVLDGIDAAEVVAQVPVVDFLALLQSARPDSGPGAGSIAGDSASMTKTLREMALNAEVQLLLGENVVRWPAVLDRISDTIDQKTGTVGVILRVDSAYSGVEPGKRPPLTKGMFVRVSLSTNPVTGIVIPRNALRSGHVLIAGDDDRLMLIPVDPFLVQDGIALITEGLQEGQRVVVSDVSPALPGMLLHVTEDSDLMAGLASAGSDK